MTSISPDRNTLYDYDLSTLTNIRLNNRKAQKRLLSERIPQSQSQSIRSNDSPFQIFTPSPLKSKSSAPVSIDRNRRSYNQDIKFDKSFLKSDNVKYLDKDFYTNGSKLNDLKRERFLDKLYSNEQLSPKNYSSNDPLKESTNNSLHFRDLGFRPRNRDIKIPSLKRPNQLSHNYSHKDLSPIRSRESQPHILNDKYEDLDFEKDTQQLKEYDDHFERLVDKYNLHELTEDRDKRRPPHPISRQSSDELEKESLQQSINQLENKVNRYRSIIKDLQANYKQERQKNDVLSRKIEDVEQYSEFLESNFDALYKKYSQLRLRNQNQLNDSINEKKRNNINTFQSSPISSPITHQDDNSTTLNLLNFKSSRAISP